MADNTPNSPGDGATGPQAAPPPGAQNITLRVLTQYTKDLSFESPGAPGSLLTNQGQPRIEASVDVGARKLGDNDYEAELKVTARAVRGEVTSFIVELAYAGLFRIETVSEDALQAILLIECPRMLFPFARRVIADVTRDGGFAPLMIDPIDFAGLYRRQMEQRAGDAASPALSTPVATEPKN